MLISKTSRFIHGSILLLCICLFFNACTTFKLADKYTNNKFKKKDFQRQIKTIGDVSVEYWDNHNKKPVLVLIHGFGATANFQWFKQIKSLEKEYRLIIPSLLYFGETTPITNYKYGVQDQVNIISGLLDSLKIDNAHICGVSYGGLVAGEFTRQNPERVNKLVLFDAVLKFYSEEDVKNLCDAYDVSDFKELFVPQNEKELKRLIKVAYLKPPQVPAFLLKSAYKELYKAKLNHLKLLLSTMYVEMSFLKEQEYKFKNETLLIWGEQDDVVPLSLAKQLNQHLVNSKLITIPKTKHMPNLEKPRLFNSIITEFLKEN